MKTTPIKTIMMETSNTLLNTISAQITYTRGALIALFAGLFILAACGGNALVVVADTGEGKTDACATNIFDNDCGVERQAERTSAINACITAISTGESATCDENIPMEARNCLNAPFTTEGCSDALASDRVSVTIETVQETRKTDCRAGTVSGSTCTGAIVNVCGEVSSTKDGVLFTETLCGDAYNARRSTLVTACVDAVEGGETREDSTACASVIITTDSAANEKALDCVLDPLGEGCDTNDDVMTVIEKTDDTIKSIDDVKIDRVAFCRGADDFATNSLCTNAITTTCAGNPFTLTTGDSPVNFCTGANDRRATLIGRCSDEDANNDEGCDTTIGTGTATVAECITDPFDATNGCSTNTGFGATRMARTTLCETDATLFDGLCDNFGAAGAITSTRNGICETEATSFNRGCLDRLDGVALAMRKAFIQTCIATPGTACDVPTSSLAVTVTLCIKNPHREECKDDLDFAEVKSDRTTLCTNTELYFNPLCNSYENIDTIRETRCTEGASSFDAICDGKNYDEERTAGQKQFIEECRDSSVEECGTIMITAPAGPISIAECVNKDANDPWKVTCQAAVFEAERTARSLECATFATTTNPNNTPCANATLNDSCVNNPFIPSCNAEGYDDVRTNRDAYCRGAGRTDGDSLCIGRQTYICGGANPDSLPTADICGADTSAGEQAFCATRNLDTGTCSNDATAVCEDNPFNSGFGAYRLNCTISTYYTNRIPACSGETDDLSNFGAVIGDCAVDGVADVICGTGSGDGSNPFAPICAKSEATANIGGFNQLMEQQRFCGTTRVTTGDNVMDCGKIYTGLCVGADSVNTAAGAGGFDCLNDGDGGIMGEQNTLCTAPATSFTKNCAEGTHGEVDKARKMLAETCRARATQSSPGCGEPVNGDSGRTVLQCSGNETSGDPYHAECDDDLFEAEQTVRAEYCSDGARATTDPFCVNAIAADPCIEFPFGTVTGNDGDAECDRVKYEIAQGNRLTHCLNAEANDPLCGNVSKALCDGNEVGDNPFALDCGTDNRDAQNTWCDFGANSGKPECLTQHGSACSLRPFSTEVFSRNNTEFNCLTHTVPGEPEPRYAAQRRLFCATGRDAPDKNCDTTEIAKVVCANSRGVHANPFADFCDTSEKDEQNEAALLATRQTVLSFCENIGTDNSAEPVCVNADDDIIALNRFCDVGANSIMARCTYTEYVATQKQHCAGADSNTVFDGNCVNGKHGEVDAARKTECRKTGSVLFNEQEACTEIVAGLCSEGGTSVLQSKAAASGYLCIDKSGTNYNGEREVLCGVTGTGEGALTVECKATLVDICKDADLIGTSVGEGRYDCSTSTDTAVMNARQGYCADNASVVDCAPTLTALCMKDDNSVGTEVATGVPANNYDCFNSAVEGVEFARQAYCANPTGDDTGCDSVLTTLCSGAKSFLSTAETGVPGTTFNCTIDTYLPQRKEHCATGENDDASADCRAVITTLCALGASVQIEVATGGVSDNKYNCSTSTVPAVITARKTYCRLSTSHGDGLSASNSGGLCADTISNLCTADPFESVTGGASASLCIDASGQVTYKIQRERLCSPRPTTGGNVANCEMFLGTLCEGREFGKSGAFEGGYNCATDPTFNSEREIACGVSGTGEGALTEECKPTLVDICKDAMLIETSVGDGRYNCLTSTDTAVMKARQGHCANNASVVDCAPTLTMLCGGNNGENSIGTGVATGVDANNYDCFNSAVEGVRFARQAYCADPTGDTTGCNSVLTTLCALGASVKDEVTTGVDGKDYNCSTSEVPDVVTARKTYCRANNLNGLCTTTVMKLCEADEFEQKVDDETYVCGTVDGVDYASKRETTCETRLGEPRCKLTIERICGTAIAPVINQDNYKNLLCSGGDYTVERGKVCSEISDKSERGIQCGTEEGDGDLAAYCGTGPGTMDPSGCPDTFADVEHRACLNTNPFAGTCDERHHDARVQACRDGDKMALVGDNCDATVVLICEGGVNGEDTITANPFHTLCNDGTTYDKARLNLCEGDPANLPTGPTGGAKLCKDNKLSGAICGTGTGDGSDSTHGSNPFADICNQSAALTEHFNLAVARGTFCTEFSYNNNCTDNAAVKWKDTAVDKDGSPGLNVLSAGDADGITNTAIDENNPVTNYILGQTNGLNLGFDQANVPNTITGFKKDDLKLEDLDSTYAGDGDGVAFATFTNTEDTTPAQKFYAGLLSNTDLGAPLTTENNLSTVWNAKAAIIVGTGAVVTDDFTLEVIFDVGGNTITTRTGDLISFGTGITFAIMGKFNTDGVIFGETTYTDTNSGDSSIGTVTGLIGEYGAVGAFISGSTNDAGDFAGGFVADNPNAGLIDCTKKGIPFNRTACPNADVVRAQVCHDRATALSENEPLGFNETTDCRGDVVEAICANNNNGTTYENIFDSLCNNNAGYKTLREDGCRRGVLPPLADCSLTIETFCEFENSASANIFDSLCLAGYVDERKDACSLSNAPLFDHCEGTIASICGTKPFTKMTGTMDNLCVDASEDTTYADARAGDCRLLINAPSTKGATTDNCKPVAMRVCAVARPLFKDTLCLEGDTYASNRIDSCSVANPVGDILTLCRESNLLNTICNGDDTDDRWNPYADICASASATADISSFDLTAKRQDFRGLCGTENTNPHCAGVIANFCGSATDDQLFETLCDKDYKNARIAACNVDNADTVVHSSCTTLISDNCSGTPEMNSPACPQANTLPASFWETAARNENNSGALTVLDAVGLDDDYTNYVKGGVAGLQLGAVAKGDGSIKGSGSGVTVTFKNGTVSFADLDHLAGTESENGAAFAFIDVLDSNNDENSFTDNALGRVDTRGRYYAGLFSGTDLGGAIVGSTGTAIWNAAFSGYSSGGSVVNNFTVVDLRINFTDKKIETIGRVIMSNGAGISIAGNFTDKGVIYGTSSWTVGQDSATGTVTGLIGKKGAVGAFVSSGENDDTFEYAGGFVAAPVTDANCTDASTELPFHRLCDADDSEVMNARRTICTRDLENSFAPRCTDADYVPEQQRTNFAETCRMAPGTTGCDTVIAGAGTLTVNHCTNTASGHPHQAGCEDAGFTAQRVARIGECVTTGNALLSTPKCMGSGIMAVNDFCKDTPFDTDCDIYAAHYQPARMSFIDGCGDPAVTRGTIGGRDCSDPLILAALCADDGKPVSFLCDGYLLAGDITTLRQGFCRDDIKGVDARCVPTRKQFCDTKLGTNMIFDALCDDAGGTYNIARGTECAKAADAGSLPNEGCGAEGTTDTYLFAFCDTVAGATNETHCPIKVGMQVAGLDTDDWIAGAQQNTDITDLDSALKDLTPLNSVGADDAEDANYVKAGKNGLELGVVNNQNATIDSDILMLSEAGITDDLTSGVAFARIDYSEFTAGSKVKHYAGILAGTDLGAQLVMPTIDVDTKGEVKWDLAVSIAIGDGDLLEVTGTKLYIHFANKSFQSRNGKNPIDFDITTFLTEKFYIEGKFNTEGIVYGRTRLSTAGKNAAHSGGSLTGLIGNEGLVAAFVSDGAAADGTANTKEYSGGFVAVNPNPVDSDSNVATPTDCSATGFLFDTTTCAEDSHRDLRVSLCENRDTVILPAGINTADHCNTAEVKAVICVIDRNPFDTICDGGAYTELRGEWCRANTGQRLAQCGNAATPNSYIAIYCRDTRPLAAICDGEAGAEDGLYATERHTICAPEAVKSNPLVICVPVIDRLCNAEPFNIVAGEGATKVNCLTAIDTKYTTARQNRIRLCADGTQSGDSRCTQESVTDITRVCSDNPFHATCTPYATHYRTLRVQRIALCADGTKSTDSRCEHAEVLTITNACTTDPFASDCTPYAVQYTMERTTRLNDCLTPSGTREDRVCTNADAVICSGYSPFDTICADTSNHNVRRAAVLACAPDNTRADDYVLPAFCDTIITTAAVTVRDCVADPLNKGCGDRAVEMNISDCRADSKRLVAACNMVVTTASAIEVTVKDCVEDPLHPRCDRTMFMAEIITCEGDGDREVPECDVVVSATTINISDCVADPWNAECPQYIFDNIVKAAVCETPTTSFTAGCLDPNNGFDLVEIRGRATLSHNARKNLIERCATDTTMNTDCDVEISGNVTLRQCIANPFRTECREGVIASALAGSSAALAKRTELIGRCADSGNSNRTNCDTIVAGILTIEDCTATPFVADCSGDEFTAAFNPYRADDCTTAATSFKAGCTQNAYSVTEANEVTIKYRDTARAERALGCADPDDLDHNNCTDIVSGSLTVDMCNADPFHADCESPAFTHARLEACEGGSTNAACSVETALERTNYVAGTVTGLKGLDETIYAKNKEGTDLDETYNYVKDDPETRNIDESAVYQDGVVAMDHLGFPISDNDETPIDESRVLVEDTPGNDIDESKRRITYDDPNTLIDETRALVDERIRASSLTLNEVLYPNGEPVVTDKSTSGFALVYIPDVRGADRMVTSPSRYYAGLLSGTKDGVGAPLQDGFVTAKWDAKLAIVSQGELNEVDFTLDVNFATKTIGASGKRTFVTTREQTYPEREDGNIVIKTRTVLGREERDVDYAYTRFGQFVIAGKFTANGVIYGATRLNNDGNDSSQGTLTGVIGTQGAVGAFVSSGSGNRLGEYAGGFVAVPDFDCTVNPLDVRCNVSEYHEARENACSGSEGWRNPACDPVFARVCAISENAVLSDAKSDNAFTTASLDCLNAPKILEDRKYVCDNFTDVMESGVVSTRCAETAEQTCTKNIFGADFCNRISTYQDMQYTACARADVRGEIFNPDTTSITAGKCFDIISPDCSIDPFESRFCYITNQYHGVRLEKCSNHNNVRNAACVGTTIDGVQVSVFDTYCLNRADADDDYGVCNSFAVQVGRTAQAWRGNPSTPRNVIGAGSAALGDSGFIAGGVSRLALGDGVEETTGQVTLRLTSPNNAGDGIAIATGAFDNAGDTVLQSYAGLLATSNLGPLGLPITGNAKPNAFWTAQIALAWQDGDDATEVTILRNDNFALKVSFEDDITTFEANLIAVLGGPAEAKISISGSIIITRDNGVITNNGFITGGLVSLSGVDTNLGITYNADINGVFAEQGKGAILATFVTTGNRSGDNAFAGGFVAENLNDPCATNGTGNPFKPANGCSDAAKLTEANRCYNNGRVDIYDGDCDTIRVCFGSGGGELFGISPLIIDSVTTKCQNPLFAGARAVYCSQRDRILETAVNAIEYNCKRLADGETVGRTAEGGNYNACIGRPFGATCETALGAVAYEAARLVRATYCMEGANAETHKTGFCQEFINRVGTCSNNPFGSGCAGTFMTQGIEGFADMAQISRLAYCNADDANADSALCTGTLTHCAGTSPSPHQNCGTLVADYCLGGMGRSITGNTGACPAELATTCDVDPFNTLTRCVEEYDTARQEHCDGTMPVENLSLDKCLNTGLDLTICGDMNSLGSNPFAEVCKSDTSNANFDELDDAKEFYCRDGGTDLDTPISVSEPNNCASIVTSICGVGEFNYTTTSEFAFDPLCRQETYNYARFAACGGDKTSTAGDDSYYTGGCGTFIDTVCPAGTVGTLIGCAPNENSTPISVWDNDGNALGRDGVSALKIERNGGVARGGFGQTAATGAFMQAGFENFNLIAFDRPAQWKVTLEGDTNSGVAFASARSHAGGLQLFTGLLRGTNVGGPLLNNSADGQWAGKVRLFIGSSAASADIGFTLNVAFTGNGGTLTTHTGSTDDATNGDIDVSSIDTVRLGGVMMRISGAFNTEGVIYGTTDLYNTKRTVPPFPTYTNSRVVGTLTGLIGKAGAVAAFYGINNSQPSNISQYAGGFTATPASDNLYEVGDNCTFAGAAGDTGNFLFSSACDYATNARALWCGGLTAFDDVRLAICRQEAIQKLVCKGTGAYANPFTSLVCNSNSTGKSTRPFTAEEIAANKLTFANHCDAGTATGDCSKDVYVRDCLDDPYSVGCAGDLAFADIRTEHRPKFCDGLGVAAGDPGNICEGALEFCAGDLTQNKHCGGLDNFVSRVCLATQNRMINNEDGHCTGSINAECDDNPFHARCLDSIDKMTDKYTQYDDERESRCDGFSEEYLMSAEPSVLHGCYLQAPAICGYYVAAQDLKGPKTRLENCELSATNDPQKEVIETGSNPFAAICTNKIVNAGRSVRIVKADPDGVCPGADENAYDQRREGEANHKNFVLKKYTDANCPETATAVARIPGCPAIDLADTQAGYNAWKAAVGSGLIAVGDARDATEKTSFIAGHHSGLFLGVGTAGAAANGDAFTIPGTASGFAYATTGTLLDTKLFTGLLAGTTNLGVAYTSTPQVTWLSNLSFLVLRDGVISKITKDGFVFTLSFNSEAGDNGIGTITGRENVLVAVAGTDSMDPVIGTVFEVAGRFTGNLLSGTVTLGEADATDINAFKVGGGLQSTGILTGVIGVDGAVGVFKSDAGGAFGDFVGGFVAAPPGPATETIWARSFHGRGSNNDLALHSPGTIGLNITDTTAIADGAREYVRLNANNQPMLLESTGAIIRSIAFFNNNGLVTPDNGDSGVTFGSFARVRGGVNLVGLWPTTNMGLPLTAEPKTAIWRGKLSAIYAGVYSGEKDARFTIAFDGQGGTVETTERVFIVVENGFHQYINIDAQFDRFGAIYGTTSVEQVEKRRGFDDKTKPAGAVGTVSGLIGEKGLIGGFISTKHVPDDPNALPGTPSKANLGHIYLGGFYALNPDAQRAVKPGAATNAGLWDSSLQPGGLNSKDAGGFVVANFGKGITDGTARFARFGVGDHITEEKRIYDGYLTDGERTNNPLMSQALSFSFGKDNGVGFGVVGNGYYSGLMEGANVGLSLTKNQAINPSSPSATWTGEIALYGRGNGLGGNNKAPSNIKQTFSLKVTFDGTVTDGTAGTIAVNPYEFGPSLDNVHLFKLTITDVKFDAAGVITGTTSLATPTSNQGLAVSGVLTGLIGTRGAIGSFISTGTATGTTSDGTYAGSYAGGFIVQNPDYKIVKEIPVIESADLGGIVNYDTWKDSFASGQPSTHGTLQASNYIAGTPVAGTYFIEATNNGISGIHPNFNDTLTLDESDGDGTFTPSAINGVAYGIGDTNNSFASLWGGANLGGALKSPPTSAIWTGEIGAVRSITNLGKSVFRLSITFEGSSGTVKSSGADGVTDMTNGDYQRVNNDYEYRFAGDFTKAGVMTGIVGSRGFSSASGVFNGIIGIKGALGTFKSDAGTISGRRYAGGFTASNPDYNTPGVTPAYNRWRSSFDGAGLNGRAKKPGDATVSVTNPLQPRGVNVNQFADGSTHFVQGTDVGLNLVGSNTVTAGFTPKLLKLEGNPKVGFALWQGDVNVAGSGTTNTQGYVGLLNGTNVGESPLSFVGVTYTGKIFAYVGDTLSPETDFALTIDYSNNLIDGEVMLEGTNFVFDGGFNVRGVMFGDVLTGASGADGVQGSFNGLIGTKAAVGVFKNTAGSTGDSFIGGFVAEPRVDFNDWTASFAGNPNALLADGDASTQTGSFRQGFFIRGTDVSIQGIVVNTRILTLTSDADSGVAFGHRPHDEHRENPHQTTYYAGLLSDTDVGRHIDNKDLNMVWTGTIRSYVLDGTLTDAVDFFLDVEFGASGLTGSQVGKVRSTTAVTGGTKGAIGLGHQRGNIDINGTFNRSGVMSGTATHVPYRSATSPEASNGTFTGLIGTLGAVGVFKDNGNGHSGQTDAFLGGFVANPPAK